MRDKIEGLHILSLTSQNASHLKKHRPAAGRQVHDRNESPSPSYEKQGVLHLSLPVCGPPARSVARQSPHRHRHGRQARSCQVSRPARARHRPFRCQSRASRRARQASARLCKLRRARARNDLRAQAPVRSDKGVLARTDEESHPASAQAQTSRRHHGAGHLRSARPTVGKEDDNRIEDPWTAGSDLHAREA